MLSLLLGLFLLFSLLMLQSADPAQEIGWLSGLAMLPAAFGMPIAFIYYAATLIHSGLVSLGVF